MQGMSIETNTSNTSISGAFTKKPMAVVLREHAQENQQQEHRHLSLWDLISVGVGGTVGSGIFELTGLIANQYARIL